MNRRSYKLRKRCLLAGLVLVVIQFTSANLTQANENNNAPRNQVAAPAQAAPNAAPPVPPLDRLARLFHHVLLVVEMIAAVVYLAFRITIGRLRGCICCSLIASGGVLVTFGWLLDSLATFFAGIVLLYSGRFTNCCGEVHRQGCIIWRHVHCLATDERMGLSLPNLDTLPPNLLKPEAIAPDNSKPD